MKKPYYVLSVAALALMLTGAALGEGDVFLSDSEGQADDFITYNTFAGNEADEEPLEEETVSVSRSLQFGDEGQ